MKNMNSAMTLPLVFFVLLVLLAGWTERPAVTHAMVDTSSSTHSLQEKKTTVRRERYLDHWDSDTLAYYLDEYPGYDLAVMFYAPWDSNSHALAPYWDRIAELLNAGNSPSKLIMALFDCEMNLAHTLLCEELDVQVYPTLMFIGSGPFYDSDPVTRTLFGKKRSEGLMGASPVPNAVKFQGLWQYTDSIYDWIRTMQALSRWHTWSTKGFGRRLRNFFLRHKTPSEPLPIGVPGRSGALASKAVGGSTFGASPAGAGGGGGDVLVASLERQLDAWKNATREMETLADRTAIMMETVLLSGDNYTDMFTFLHERNAWDSQTNATSLNEVYRSCVLEVSLDYCQRVATHVGSQIVEDLENSGKTAEEMLAESANIEESIIKQMTQKEPYCGIIETCLMNDMKDEACRPKACPFANEIACRYLTSCQDPSIVLEYAEALGLEVANP